MADYLRTPFGTAVEPNTFIPFSVTKNLPFTASSGAIWTPVNQVWIPTQHPKHTFVYVDGNSGNEMGTVAANNVPVQAMPKDTWITVDLSSYGMPTTIVGILGLFIMVSAGYAGSPPVSFTVSVRAPGYTGLSLGDYIAATTAATGGGYRSFVTCTLPVVNRSIEFSYQQPISTTTAAINAGTGAPQILQLIPVALFGS